MSWILNALASSVGRKLVMALTGLFLSLFLLIHLAGNFLLFVGPEQYDAYAHTLHSQKAFLIFSEVLLYGAFGAHVYLAFRLTRDNWSARKKLYRVSDDKRDDRIGAGWIAPEKWMLFSGLIVLGFTILHVADFKFELGWDGELAQLSPYGQAQVILASYSRIAIYTIGCVILGVHVSHGFQSAWQSLGVNHPRVNSMLRYASVLFGIVVAVGFSSFPVLRGFGVWGDFAPVQESREAQEADLDGTYDGAADDGEREAENSEAGSDAREAAAVLFSPQSLMIAAATSGWDRLRLTVTS